MIQMLADCLQNVYGELVEICEDIERLSPVDQYDQYNDLEEVRNNVEICIAMVTGHLESRAEEGTSSGSITST